jgi:hypothetical protein
MADVRILGTQLELTPDEAQWLQAINDDDIRTAEEIVERIGAEAINWDDPKIQNEVHDAADALFGAEIWRTPFDYHWVIRGSEDRVPLFCVLYLEFIQMHGINYRMLKAYLGSNGFVNDCYAAIDLLREQQREAQS